jgi:SAM-dependent methyltransferase
MPEETPDANAAMRDYWNTVAGPRWAAAPGSRERRNRESLALLLERLGLEGGESVLEIGCGAGALTVPLAAAVGEQGRVVAVDIAEPMLNAARQRVEERGLKNVTLHLGDAQVFAFEPAAFDLATSRMGVMFFADPAAAFRNIGGALKPGGRLVFACWGPPSENRHWLVAYDAAVRHLGPPAPRPAHEPGPMAFADPEYIRGFLGTAGFADILVERAHPTIIGSTPEEEARQAMAMGPTARRKEPRRGNPPNDRPRHQGSIYRRSRLRRNPSARHHLSRHRPPPGVNAVRVHSPPNPVMRVR